MNDIDQTKINQVLSDLAVLVKRGLVSKEQVLRVFGESQVPFRPPVQPTQQKINLQKILYYIGGLIVLLGIVFFIAQSWSGMSQISKAILTLGSAISAYAIGYHFFCNTQSKEFGHAFLVIATALFPLGIGTTLDTIGVSAAESGGASINAALLFIIYFVSYSTLKAKIFLPFSVIAASALFFTFTDFLLGGTDLIPHFHEYRLLVLGGTYLSFGYHFSQTDKKFITNSLYFWGLLFVLGTGLGLQGHSPNSNFFWQIIYPFLLVVTFWGSIKLQNKVFLIMATLFTFGEILKLTAEYFSKSVGWPVSLIIAGLIIMGVGYMSFELNKRFLKARPASR